MTILFISDIHLSASNPILFECFKNFLKDQAYASKALYILGDLFDAWVGDDEDDPFAQEVIQTLNECAQHTKLLMFLMN